MSDLIKQLLEYLNSLSISVVAYFLASALVGLSGTLYATDIIQSGLVIAFVFGGWLLSWIGALAESADDQSSLPKNYAKLWFSFGIGMGIAATMMFSTLFVVYLIRLR